MNRKDVAAVAGQVVMILILFTLAGVLAVAFGA